jgi:hypothetical protein
LNPRAEWSGASIFHSSIWMKCEAFFGLVKCLLERFPPKIPPTRSFIHSLYKTCENKKPCFACRA